jgi:hypothetical protein
MEKEFVIPNYVGSSTLSVPVARWTPGRPVVVQEIFAHMYMSTTAFSCTSNSCTINIYRDQSLSNQIGSLCLGSADIGSVSGMIVESASLTSTSLGSTDMLAFCNESIALAGGGGTYGITLVVRYRER